MISDRWKPSILRMIMLLFIALFSTLSIQAQWQDISPSGASDVLFFDVEFIDDNIGFAVGQNTSSGVGYIYKTTNGGQSWSSQSFSNHHLRAIAFSDDNTILVSGYDGPPGTNTLHLRSTDQGDNWIAGSDNGFTTGFNGVEFVNQNDGFAYGYGPIFGMETGLFKTTDKGQTWASAYAASGMIEGIHFFDQNTGFITYLGPGWPTTGEIMKTTDGGTSFQSKYTGGWLRDIIFVNTDKGFAIEGLSNRILLVTQDGGENWNSEPLDNDANHIQFIDDATGYIAGKNGLVLKSIDGGVQWNPETSGITQAIESISYSSNYVYCSGRDGKVIKALHGVDLGGGPVPLSPPFLSAPADESKNVGINPEVSWDEVSTAIEYTMEYSTDENFSNNVTSVNTSKTSYRLEELNYNQIYFWRVKANDGTSTSSWSSVWEFRTKINDKNSWPVGVREVNDEKLFLIYPNPSNGSLSILLETPDTPKYIRVVIYNQLGQEVYKMYFTENKTSTMDLAFLQNGIYTVRLQTDSGMAFKSLVINK